MNLIYNADSIKLAKKTEKKTVDLVLTDIPYGISRKNNFHTMGRTGFNFDWDKENFFVNSISHIVPLLKKGGSALIFSSFEQIKDLDVLMHENGMLRKDKLIWSKTNAFPRNTKRRYVASSEVINWYVTKKGKWTFNKSEDVPYIKTVFEYPIATHLSKFHPTAKPIALLEKLITIHSNEGDLILDPFAGAMTTAAAADNIGRNFVVCEKDEENFLRGKELLKKLDVKFTDGGSR